MEHLHALQRHILARGDQLRPVRLLRRCDGRVQQPVVVRGVIGADVKKAVAFIDVVLNALLARLDHLPHAVRLIRRQYPPLGGDVAYGSQQQVTAVACALRANVVALVLLVVDDGVLRSIRTQHMTMQQIRALGLSVFGGIEERLVVGRPCHGVHALRGVRQKLAGAQVLHMQPVLTEAHRILGVGHQIGVVAHIHGAQGEELLALRHLIAVQQHLFRCVERALLAAQHAVLLALLRARVVPVAVLAVWHRVVCLLNVAQCLGVQLLRQRLLGGRGALRIGVLRLQVLMDLGIIPLPQPRVVIHQNAAVDRALGVNLLRYRRRGHLRGNASQHTGQSQPNPECDSHGRILPHHLTRLV